MWTCLICESVNPDEATHCQICGIYRSTPNFNKDLAQEFVALLNKRNLLKEEFVRNSEAEKEIEFSRQIDDIDKKINTFRNYFRASLLTGITPKNYRDEVEKLLGDRNIKIGFDEYSLLSKIESTAVVNQTFQEESPRSLREWWHSVIREHGHYKCYSIFLVLPSDKEAINYLSEFGKELDIISGDDCLVIAFGKTKFKGQKFDEKIWSDVINEYVDEGISVKIAKMFKIEFTQFPCLLIFKDIRTPEHVIITLKDSTSESIATNMRQVFSVINKAVSKKQDPIHALSLKRKSDSLQKTGLSFISEVQSFAGKTLETAMEAFIKANVQ